MQHKQTIVSKYRLPFIIGATIIAGLSGLGFWLHNQYLHKALFTADSGTAEVYNSKLITVPKKWAIGWHYDCSNIPSDKAAFDIIVSDAKGKTSITDGPVSETGQSGTGVTIMPDSGTYKVTIGSTGGCGWTAAAKRSSFVAGFDHETAYLSATAAIVQPTTLLDLTGSGSQQTKAFTTSKKWNVAYTYDCSNLGSQGNFQFDVNDTDGSSNTDTGANDLGVAGGTTDYYYDAGEHYLSVNSECTWHIKVIG